MAMALKIATQGSSILQKRFPNITLILTYLVECFEYGQINITRENIQPFIIDIFKKFCGTFLLLFVEKFRESGKQFEDLQSEIEAL